MYLFSIVLENKNKIAFSCSAVKTLFLNADKWLEYYFVSEYFSWNDNAGKSHTPGFF